MLSVKNEALRKFIPFHRSMAFIEKGYKLIFHFNFLFSIFFFFQADNHFDVKSKLGGLFSYLV